MLAEEKGSSLKTAAAFSSALARLRMSGRSGVMTSHRISYSLPNLLSDSNRSHLSGIGLHSHFLTYLNGEFGNCLNSPQAMSNCVGSQIFR